MLEKEEPHKITGDQFQTLVMLLHFIESCILLLTVSDYKLFPLCLRWVLKFFVKPVKNMKRKTINVCFSFSSVIAIYPEGGALSPYAAKLSAVWYII